MGMVDKVLTPGADKGAWAMMMMKRDVGGEGAGSLSTNTTLDEFHRPYPPIHHTTMLSKHPRSANVHVAFNGRTVFLPVLKHVSFLPSHGLVGPSLNPHRRVIVWGVLGDGGCSTAGGFCLTFGHACRK